jgi:hypothetical protein
LFLPKTFYDSVNWEEVTVIFSEFLSGEWTEARADLVFRIPLKNYAKILEMYVVMEHKSSHYFTTIQQAAQYGFHIGQMEIRQAKEGKRFNDDFRLSPVLLGIFYHGKTPFNAPDKLVGTYHSGGRVSAALESVCF